ncbi:type II toxin-antitoxin system MqsA family antitoxin [Thiorhodococcus mannitoliphagus]|uniref:Type II toxin-antitoxin system MqsA family antitoxin n=1 Tax=Thiorhodococcus mannitoliphagus TaxID=329406 RepID=A0A6P1DVQ1_9GAMM|nr:type II toxin-antitoxin system MqsA family antitoxin [Thiorhodococcus mannitoliphagus]
MKPACPLCCGGDQRQGSTTFTADLGFGVVVVRHVPAQICDQCGEEWLHDDIAETLEAIVADAHARHSLVDVREWRDQAA